MMSLLLLSLRWTKYLFGNMLTESQKIEIQEMYSCGWNPEDIADELGADETEVIDYCSELL